MFILCHPNNGVISDYNKIYWRETEHVLMRKGLGIAKDAADPAFSGNYDCAGSAEH